MQFDQLRGRQIRGSRDIKHIFFLQWFDFWFINSRKQVAVIGCINNRCNYSCVMAKGRDVSAFLPSNTLFFASEEVNVTVLYVMDSSGFWQLEHYKKTKGAVCAYVLKYVCPVPKW